MHLRQHGDVAEYWSRQIPCSATKAVSSALGRTGIDPTKLTKRDIDLLSGLDEFHCLGKKATLTLAQLAGVRPEARVLDVGCGIGGPSRRLAVEFGCIVTGIDLTKDYLSVAVTLGKQMNLLGRDVRYVQANAVDLPLADESFDFVWMQAVACNIENRLSLYREIRRVLRRDGRVGIFDILAGSGGSVRFPVPWASDPTTSFLFSKEQTESLIALAGLKVVTHHDVSKDSRDWFAAQQELDLRPEGVPPLGFQVLLPDWGVMAANQVLNLDEERIKFAYTILQDKDRGC